MKEALDGQVAVITGAGPGIGGATAMAFARGGASVVVAARDSQRLQALAKSIGDETGVSTEAMRFDLTDQESCRTLIDRVIERYGRVDSLVNVATVAGGSAIDTDDFDLWRHAFGANVVGTLELSRSAARSMCEQQSGAIVQIGTMSTYSKPAMLAAYASTKQALATASFVMAKEVGRSNVRVNVVTPGYINGPDLDLIIDVRAARRGQDKATVSAELAKTAALRRHVDPEDIANAALFLCSHEARNITGVDLPVTAGQAVG